MPTSLDQCSVHHLLDTGELGGGNLVALQTARLMKPHLGENHLWLDPGPAEAIAKADGLTLHNLGQAALRSAGKLSGRFLEWKLRRQLRRYTPGIAHVSSAFLYGLTNRALQGSGLLRLVHVQIEDTIPNWRWAFREPPEMVVTCAKFLVHGVREALPDRLRDQIPVIAISNGVDVDRFAPAPDKIAAKRHVNAPTDRPLLLMLANLAPHKGQRTAIETVSLLKNRGIDVECWLAGTERGGANSFTTELNQQIDQAGVRDRVKLLGHRSDAPELLRAADVFLLPSTNEGLPLSILEAQSARVPVLAAPTAGVPETIAHGVTGFLHPAEDATAYADTVAQLLSDTFLRERIVDTAMTQVRTESTWSVFAKRMLQSYQELAKTIPS